MFYLTARLGEAKGGIPYSFAPDRGTDGDRGTLYLHESNRSLVLLTRAYCGGLACSSKVEVVLWCSKWWAGFGLLLWCCFSHCRLVVCFLVFSEFTRLFCRTNEC